MRGTGVLHTRFWWRNVSERDRLKYLGIDERIILKRIFKNCDGEA
jgi:hypothetical protein